MAALNELRADPSYAAWWGAQPRRARRRRGVVLNGIQPGSGVVIAKLAAASLHQRHWRVKTKWL
jgi:hypothetical protein